MLTNLRALHSPVVGVVHPRECLRDNEGELARPPNKPRAERDHDVPCALIIRRRVVVTPSGSGIFLRSGNIACVRERLSDSLNTFQDRSERAFEVL